MSACTCQARSLVSKVMTQRNVASTSRVLDTLLQSFINSQCLLTDWQADQGTIKFVILAASGWRLYLKKYASICKETRSFFVVGALAFGTCIMTATGFKSRRKQHHFSLLSLYTVLNCNKELILMRQRSTKEVSVNSCIVSCSSAQATSFSKIARRHVVRIDWRVLSVTPTWIFYVIWWRQQVQYGGRFPSFKTMDITT